MRKEELDNVQKIRKSNFELLRIIAMFGIVVFHHFGPKTPSEFLSLPEGFTADNYFYDVINNTTVQLNIRTLMLDFCYGHFGDAGNLIFMLITGYFLYGKQVSFEKRANSAKKILLITIYWGVILTIINGVVLHYYPYKGHPLYKPTFNFPNWISGANMWYFQAYGVFILVIVPILKYFEDKVDQNIHKAIIIMLIALCFFDFRTYLPNIWISYRILQFILCYYMGGYISKYSISYSWKRLISVFLLYLIGYFIYEYYWRSGMRKMYEPYEYSYINVMAPFICSLIYAVLVFLIFSKIEIRSKLINNIAETTPGIYIFHYSFISTEYVIANTLWWKDWSFDGYCKFVIIDSILMFVVGCLLDLIRNKIFLSIDIIRQKNCT